MPQMYDSQVALYTDFREMYNDWFFAADNVNTFTDFAQVIDSQTLTEDLNFLETIPQYREWLDERALQGIGPSYHYSISAKHWEVTVQIDRDAMDDNRLALERTKVAHLGREAGRAPWQIFINALLANGKGYDGIAYFSASHTQNGQANQANTLAGTGTTVGAIITDYSAAISAARLMQDGQGRPMNLGQRGRHILAPPALEQQWQQILHNDTIAVSTSTGVFGSSTNPWKGSADLTIDPYLTDTNDWYLMLTAEPGLPFVYVNRKPPEFVSMDAPTAPDNFMRRMLAFGADWRSQAGYGPWYLAIRTTN